MNNITDYVEVVITLRSLQGSSECYDTIRMEDVVCGSPCLPKRLCARQYVYAELDCQHVT